MDLLTEACETLAPNDDRVVLLSSISSLDTESSDFISTISSFILKQTNVLAKLSARSNIVCSLTNHKSLETHYRFDGSFLQNFVCNTKMKWTICMVVFGVSFGYYSFSFVFFLILFLCVDWLNAKLCLQLLFIRVMCKCHHAPAHNPIYHTSYLSLANRNVHKVQAMALLNWRFTVTFHASHSVSCSMLCLVFFFCFVVTLKYTMSLKYVLLEIQVLVVDDSFIYWLFVEANS